MSNPELHEMKRGVKPMLYGMMILIACFLLVTVISQTKHRTMPNGGLFLAKENLLQYTQPVLDALEEPGVAGHLNRRIEQYDSLCKSNALKEAFLMRSEDWRKYVSIDLWKTVFDKKGYTIYDITVLGARPFPSRTKPAAAFEMIKMAIIQKNDGTSKCMFYTEVWVYEHNDWFTRGGAPWDDPAAPIISLEF